MHSSARALIFSRPAVIGSLLAAFALVLGSVVLSTVSTRELTRADLHAAHARQSLALVNQLLATINEAETAQRGYLLTNDEKYLAPYVAARPRYASEVTALKRQYEGDPDMTGMMDRLGQLCGARFAEIERTVRLRREFGIAPALNVIESDEGWRLMNEIRAQLQTLQQQEIAEVAARSTRAAQEARWFQNLNWGALAFAAILAGTVAWLVVRRLHQLEGLIKVCAWTQRVQWEGHWVTFEEYLAKRFNLHCTHGISDEAARKLGQEIAHTPVPPDA